MGRSLWRGEEPRPRNKGIATGIYRRKEGDGFRHMVEENITLNLNSNSKREVVVGDELELPAGWRKWLGCHVREGITNMLQNKNKKIK